MLPTARWAATASLRDEGLYTTFTNCNGVCHLPERAQRPGGLSGTTCVMMGCKAGS